LGIGHMKVFYLVQWAAIIYAIRNRIFDRHWSLLYLCAVSVICRWSSQLKIFFPKL
jgi:hypothetical protein